MTGVVTEVDLTFPQIKDECDCIQECLNRPTICANYVWKFSTSESVQSGHRTCTLYSDFNLPSDVTLEFDLNSGNNVNINANEIIANGNNPHVGAPVPQAFKDVNLDTVPDPDAVSGYVGTPPQISSFCVTRLNLLNRPVWHLDNGQVQC